MYAMIRKMRFCTIATLCTYLFSTHVKSSAIPQLEARDGAYCRFLCFLLLARYYDMSLIVCSL